MSPSAPKLLDLRPPLALSQAVLRSSPALAAFALAACLESLALAFLPLGIAASATRAEALRAEVHWLLAIAIQLVLVLQVRRWRSLLRPLSDPHLGLILLLSSVFAMAVALVGLTLLELGLGWAPGVELPGLLPALLGAALLGTTLSFTRLDGIGLSAAFLALCWIVPALGTPATGSVDLGPKGLALPPWTADRFLPMLIPQLLAIGYVCLERARR